MSQSASKLGEATEGAHSGFAAGAVLLLTEFDPNVVMWYSRPLDETVLPNAETTFLGVLLDTHGSSISVLMLDVPFRDAPDHPRSHRVFEMQTNLHVHRQVAELPIATRGRLHRAVERDSEGHVTRAQLIAAENRRWLRENGDSLAGVLEAAVATG